MQFGVQAVQNRLLLDFKYDGMQVIIFVGFTQVWAPIGHNLHDWVIVSKYEPSSHSEHLLKLLIT